MPQPIDLVRAIRDDNAASLRNMASEAPRALRTFIAVDALEEVGGATSAVPGAAAAGPVAMDAETWLPLHFAAAWNRPELVAMLADDFGVSVDCRTRFRLPTRARQTPLILAATAGHERVVDALLQRHAEVEVRDARADGPLMLAAAAGHVGVIRRLLDAGAQLDAGDGQGRTPLHRAIRGPDAPPPGPLAGEPDAPPDPTAAALALLDAGADVNFPCPRDPAGYTPLHRCAAVGPDRLPVVEALLARGADPARRDPRHGLTPAELLQQAQHKSASPQEPDNNAKRMAELLRSTV